MSLPLLAASVLVLLVLGYRFYGRLIARQYALGSTTDTPAHRHRDDIDFVPTKPAYLFGQHFSAIAAAGPIVGPILAAQFGFLPGIRHFAIQPGGAQPFQHTPELRAGFPAARA